MELNEMIARKKAIVAMEQNAKKIEPGVEVEGKSGVTTFDYQHVHRENVWMPDLKPVKSILKKQSEPHTDPQSQVCFFTWTPSFCFVLFSLASHCLSYILLRLLHARKLLLHL